MTTEQKDIIIRLEKLIAEDGDTLNEWETDFVLNLIEDWLDKDLTDKQVKIIYKLEQKYFLG